MIDFESRRKVDILYIPDIVGYAYSRTCLRIIQ